MLENGSQTDTSAEQEMFVSIESGREPQRSPSPPHLSGQRGVFPLLQNFPQEGSSPTTALMQTLETFLPLGHDLGTHCLMTALLKLKVGGALRAREGNRAPDTGTGCSQVGQQELIALTPELIAPSHWLPW